MTQTVFMLKLKSATIEPGHITTVAECIYLADSDENPTSPREIAEKLRAQGILQWDETDQVDSYNIDNYGPVSDLPTLE